jgi:hypothetical protein
MDNSKFPPIPPGYQVRPPPPFQSPFHPPTLPPPPEGNIPESYRQKLSTLYKYPVIEQSPYGGPPFLPHYTSPQVYLEYAPT